MRDTTCILNLLNSNGHSPPPQLPSGKTLGTLELELDGQGLRLSAGVLRRKAASKP